MADTALVQTLSEKDAEIAWLRREVRRLQQQLAAADHVRKSLELARDVALKLAAGGPRRSTDRAAF